MEHAATDVNALLKTLNHGAFFERRKAAEDLARLPQSNRKIIDALMEAARSDHDPSVRRAAIAAIETPVHRQFAQSQRGLASAPTEIARLKRKQELESI